MTCTCRTRWQQPRPQAPLLRLHMVDVVELLHGMRVGTARRRPRLRGRTIMACAESTSRMKQSTAYTTARTTTTAPVRNAVDFDLGLSSPRRPERCVLRSVPSTPRMYGEVVSGCNEYTKAPWTVALQCPERCALQVHPWRAHRHPSSQACILLHISFVHLIPSPKSCTNVDIFLSSLLLDANGLREGTMRCFTKIKESMQINPDA